MSLFYKIERIYYIENVILR